MGYDRRVILLLCSLLLQDLPDGAVLRREGHGDAVRAVGWSPEGGRILSGSRDRTLVLWDAATGRKIRTFEGHDGGVTSAAFSPDGKRAVSGGQDNNVLLWDLETGKILKTLKSHSEWATAVSFFPDGRRVLTGSHDRTALIWDLETEQTKRLVGQGNRVLAAAASPSGLRAAAAGADHVIWVWSTDTAERLLQFGTGAGRDVFALAYSP